MKNGRSDRQLRKTSKFISLILRYKIETIGIMLCNSNFWFAKVGLEKLLFNKKRTAFVK